MSEGFQDILGLVGVWLPYEAEPTGTFCTEAEAVYVPGAVRRQVHVAGASQHQVYVPGSQQSDVRCN